MKAPLITFFDERSKAVCLVYTLSRGRYAWFRVQTFHCTRLRRTMLRSRGHSVILQPVQASIGLLSSGPDVLGCPSCAEQIPEHARLCPVCNGDVGFPNVRAARKREERDALVARYRSAKDAAIRRGCQDVLVQFEEAVRRSKAVFCRNWGVLCRLLSSDTELYASFYGQVRAEARLPLNTELDRTRLVVDATFFPYYYENVRFAALSINGRGPMSYGSCSIVLREAMIADRASVFEENTLVFCTRHRLALGESLPRGYRAAWHDRQVLALSKLEPRLGVETRTEDFSDILLNQTGKTDRDDFVEVHIYGPLHRKAVERVVGPFPKLPEDSVLVSSLRERLGEVGASLEFYT